MPKAILKNGVIYPLEPLPPDWQEGMELRVEKAGRMRKHKSRSARLGKWMQEVEEMARLIPPECDQQLEEAIARIRSEAKKELPREVNLE